MRKRTPKRNPKPEVRTSDDSEDSAASSRSSQTTKAEAKDRLLYLSHLMWTVVLPNAYEDGLVTIDGPRLVDRANPRALIASSCQPSRLKSAKKTKVPKEEEGEEESRANDLGSAEWLFAAGTVFPPLARPIAKCVLSGLHSAKLENVFMGTFAIAEKLGCEHGMWRMAHAVASLAPTYMVNSTLHNVLENDVYGFLGNFLAANPEFATSLVDEFSLSRTALLEKPLSLYGAESTISRLIKMVRTENMMKFVAKLDLTADEVTKYDLVTCAVDGCHLSTATALLKRYGAALGYTKKDLENFFRCASEPDKCNPGPQLVEFAETIGATADDVLLLTTNPSLKTTAHKMLFSRYKIDKNAIMKEHTIVPFLKKVLCSSCVETGSWTLNELGILVSRTDGVVGTSIEDAVNDCGSVLSSRTKEEAIKVLGVLAAQTQLSLLDKEMAAKKRANAKLGKEILAQKAPARFAGVDAKVVVEPPKKRPKSTDDKGEDGSSPPKRAKH